MSDAKSKYHLERYTSAALLERQQRLFEAIERLRGHGAILPIDWLLELEEIDKEMKSRANASLIAAAPEMLEALLAAKHFGSQGETHEGVSVSYLIDNAIAKAKGESQ